MAEKSELVRLSESFGIRANMPVMGIREMAEQLLPDPLRQFREMQQQQMEQLREALSPFTVPAQPRRVHVVEDRTEEGLRLAHVRAEIDKLPPELQAEAVRYLIENSPEMTGRRGSYGTRLDKQFYGTIAHRLLELGYSKSQVFNKSRTGIDISDNAYRTYLRRGWIGVSAGVEREVEQEVERIRKILGSP